MTKLSHNQTNAFRGPADQINDATTFDLVSSVAKGKANTEAAAARRAHSNIAGELAKGDEFDWKKLDGKIISTLDKHKKTEGDLKPEMSSSAKDMLMAHHNELEASPETPVSDDVDKRRRS